MPNYWKILKTTGEICMAAGSIILGIIGLLDGKFRNGGVPK